MDPLTATAASGMLSRSQTLDILANNIANSETAGYKADLESYNLYFGEEAWQGYHEGRAAGAEMPVIEKNWTDFSQGSLTLTGNPTDVALSSNGLFVVRSERASLHTKWTVPDIKKWNFGNTGGISRVRPDGQTDYA
jgi:flagellar basal-body rod protein FlgF